MANAGEVRRESSAGAGANGENAEGNAFVAFADAIQVLGSTFSRFSKRFEVLEEQVQDLFVHSRTKRDVDPTTEEEALWAKEPVGAAFVDSLAASFASASDPEERTTILKSCLEKLAFEFGSFQKLIKLSRDTQDARDKAQDQLVVMSLDKMDRKLKNLVSSEDFANLRENLSFQIRGVEMKLMAQAQDFLRETKSDVYEELSKVSTQLDHFQHSSEAQADIMFRRVEDFEKEFRNTFNPSAGEAATKAVFDKLSARVGEMDEAAEMLKGSFLGLEESLASLSNDFALAKERTENDKQQRIQNFAKVQRAFSELEELRSLLNAESEKRKSFQEDLKKGHLEVQNVKVVLESELKETQQSLENRTAALKEQLASVSEEVAALPQTIHDDITDEISLRMETEKLSTEESSKQLLGVINNLQDHFIRQHAKMDERFTMMHGEMEKTQQETERNAAEITALQDSTAESKDELHRKVLNLSNSLTSELQLLKASSVQHDKLLALLQKESDAARRRLQQSSEEIHRDFKRAIQTLLDEQRAVEIPHESGFEEVVEALRLQREDDINEVLRLQEAREVDALAVEDMKNSVHHLLTKENKYELVSRRLEAERHEFVKIGIHVEAKSLRNRFSAFTIEGMEIKLAVAAQRAAKLIATKVDIEITKQILPHPKPQMVPWDQMVANARTKATDALMQQIAEEIADRSKNPRTNVVEEIQEKYVDKVAMTLKVALTKYTQIQPGSTFLGRLQLQMSCMACNRPFYNSTPEAPQLGDPRSVSRDAIPGRDAEGFSPTASSRASGHSSSTKFIYRAGFRIPRPKTSVAVAQQAQGGPADDTVLDDTVSVNSSVTFEQGAPSEQRISTRRRKTRAKTASEGDMELAARAFFPPVQLPKLDSKPS